MMSDPAGASTCCSAWRWSVALIRPSGARKFRSAQGRNEPDRLVGGEGERRRTVGPWDAREAPVSRQLVGQLEGADAHATPYRAGGLDAVAGRRVLDGVHVVPLGALRHPDAVQVIQAKGVVQQLQHDREHGRVDLQRRWWCW